MTCLSPTKGSGPGRRPHPPDPRTIGTVSLPTSPPTPTPSNGARKLTAIRGKLWPESWRAWKI